MKKFLVLFLFLISWSAWALNDVDKQDLLYKNLYTNGGFENGSKDITVSSCTKSLESTTIRSGKRALKVVFDAAADYAETKTVTFPSTGADQNAVISFWYKSATATIKASVYDSAGNEINNVTYLPSNSGYQQASISFVAVSGTAYKLRFTESAGAATIYVDDIYVGVNPGISNLSQAILYGSIKYAGVSNCSWANSTGGSWQSFAEDSDCNNPTVTGKATAPGTKIPGISFSSMPKGIYYITANGYLYSSKADPYQSAKWRFTDGTNISEVSEIGNNTVGATTTSNLFGNLIGKLTLATDQGATTIQIQSNINSATSASIVANETDRDLVINVYYFPTEEKQAIQSDQANKFGSVSWTNVSNCTFTATGGVMTDADCNSGTVTPSGSITSGNDNLELTATNLKAGSVYKITANGSFGVSYSGSTTTCTFYLTDGTTISGGMLGQAVAAKDSEWLSGLIGYYSYSSFQPTKTFSVYAVRSGGSGSCDCHAENSNTACTLSIEEVYPVAQQPQLLRPTGDLSLKQYDCTVTSSLTNWATTRAVCIPYRVMDSSGNWNIWRMKFNIRGTCDSATRTSGTVSVTGVTFKNTSSFDQAIYGYCGAGQDINQGYVSANTSSITIQHASGATTYYVFSGDVELDSKPSWAY